MKTKKCSKCLKDLPLSSFYKKGGNVDKYCSACKDCTNKRARELHVYKIDKHSARMKKHYIENKEYYQQKSARYRISAAGKEVHRKAREKYLSTEKGRESNRSSWKKYYYKNREKIRAHWAVKSAILSGKLKRMPCEVCGSTDNINAHHEDYSKPLDVNWLCVKHHKKLHRKIILPDET